MTLDEGPRPMFGPSLLATGFGALWCTDWAYPVLVRVDDRDRTPQVWASWPADGGPQGVATGLDAVWVLAGQGGQVLRIDPAGGGVTSHQLPFPVAGIAAGPDAVFGIGQLGDGRVLRFTPGAAVSAPAGDVRTLSLVAASAGYVWVVDDETATVLALDAATLEPVQTFRRVGAPQALFARDAQAWYVCAAELAYQDEGGRQSRAVVLGPGWPTMDLLRLDATTGTTERLRGLPGLASAAALTGDRLWISGEQQEGPAEDPVTSLSCLDLDGRDISAIELPGQIDAIGASDSLVWVAGFRRSRQEGIVTVLDAGRSVVGEVSFGAVDVAPWAPPQADPVRLPPAERAQAIRDVLAASLSQPRQAGNRFGDQWEEPPVSPEFQLERVDLRGSADSYEIAVLFRWAGETDLFGMRFEIAPEDEAEFGVPDAYISVHLEENLLAQGYGLVNATRERADGITWLRWPRS